MARNKYPEETVQKILDVSFRLFQKKGYDHTTIQDITDALGMSKGAIYHHFRSKEEILDRINDRYYDEINWFRDIREDAGLSGLEKLQRMLIRQFSDIHKHSIDSVSVSLTRNPRLVASVLESTIRAAAPFALPLIEEGVRDGSITSSQPKELAEALLLLMNMWIGIFTEDREDFGRKLNFMREWTDAMGLRLFSGDVMRAARAYYDAVLSRAEENREA